MGAQGALGPVKALLVELTVVDGAFREADITFEAVLGRLEDLERRSLLRVMDRLCREGDLALVKEEKITPRPGERGPARRSPTWRIVRDLRLRRDNQVKTRVTCRDKVWSTLRGLRPRATTLSELMRLSGCAEKAVEGTVRALAEHGYVKVKGKIGREKAWVLVKDAGPKRPETCQPHRRPS